MRKTIRFSRYYYNFILVSKGVLIRGQVKHINDEIERCFGLYFQKSKVNDTKQRFSSMIFSYLSFVFIIVFQLTINDFIMYERAFIRKRTPEKRCLHEMPQKSKRNPAEHLDTQASE